MNEPIDNGERCDKHVGEAFPPRCDNCAALSQVPSNGARRIGDDIETVTSARQQKRITAMNRLLSDVTAQLADAKAEILRLNAQDRTDRRLF